MEYIKLKGNKITDNGLKSLCHSLYDLKINNIDLSYNEITQTGINYLRLLVETNSNIELLNIRKNKIHTKLLERVVKEFKKFNVEVKS